MKIDSPLRIAILWTELSGYFNACLQTLVQNHPVELSVFRIARKGATAHPYKDTLFSWLPRLHTLPDGSIERFETIWNEILDFSPDVAIVSGWSVPVYRKVAKQLRGKRTLVISGLDNPWRGTMKQHLGVFASRFYVRPLFDAFWVPGERAGVFARKLGYRGNRVLFGLYSADRPKLTPIAKWRMVQAHDSDGWPPRFLFVGRFANIKGLPALLEAYQRYREAVDAPWELWLAGSGPLESMVSHRPGVRNLGFVQPDQLPDLFKQVGVFVLPSRHDPWPLVIHEATSAGLPILCSRQCGSSVELVQEGYNGFRFEAGDVDMLTQLLIRMSSKTANLREMGERSVRMSERYSPRQWAENLIIYLNSMLSREKS